MSAPILAGLSDLKARPTLTPVIPPRSASLPVGVGLTLIWLLTYLKTVSPSVNFIDSGELISSLYEPGIAHPPGYPLYVLMGYVMSHVLPGEVAWRVNALSAFWGALTVGAIFFLLLEAIEYVARPQSSPTADRQGRKAAQRGRSGSRGRRSTAPEATVQVSTIGDRRTALRLQWFNIASAAVGASLLGASSTFWSRTAQAKMYTLHYFFVVLLFLLALKARKAIDEGRNDSSPRRWLIALCLGLGISLTNHLMTVLLPPGLLVLLLAGAGWQQRLSALKKQWYLVGLVLAPLLLYLYLPIRSAQGPVMDWGSPDTWGDFWRHVRGWQYQVYLFSDAASNVGRLIGYVADQWAWLSFPVLILSAAGGALLARTAPVLFAATLLTAFLTFLFSVAYGISEVEPYMVPFYLMLVVWLGTLPASIQRLAVSGEQHNTAQSTSNLQAYHWGATGLLALLAISSAIIEFPRQDHSNDRLAGQFVSNVFSTLPPNSLLITDYWDFYAPTYYLQQIEQLRPDLTLVDMSLLKYPWYTGQLKKRYPWLLRNSEDILLQFSTEQRKWVNGEAYNNQLLNDSYVGLLTSFVERNTKDHPAYVLFQGDCNLVPAPNGCMGNNIAPKYTRQPVGLANRLWPTSVGTPELPPEPNYALEGIVANKVAMDEFARQNSSLYVDAYARLASLYARAGKTDMAQRMSRKATEIQQALVTVGPR